MKSGQSIEAAAAALAGALPQIREATMPDYRPEDRARYLSEGFTLMPAATGASTLRTRYRPSLIALTVVVALVLLVACANVANLLLARATARRHELSVRQALGASRSRLAGQLLAESVLLSGAGAVLGLAFAQWGSRLLVRQLSTQTNTVFLDLGPDWRVLGFTALVAVGTALLFGTAPALRATRVEPIEAIKDQGRGSAREGRIGGAGGLVVVQVALSLSLVVAAGLFLRTFATLTGSELGFDRDRVLVVSMNAQRSRVPPEGRHALYERLRQAAGAVPGVARAAASVLTPVSGTSWNEDVKVRGAPELPERDRLVYMNLVTPDWFATYGTTILAGRDFDERD
ncbi:MAG: FtsX-like permease family protein, partial [Sporichthyaceae bacterium]|nr:FtsX-like permease family protein [Sporichthyaceae bacterium]